MTTRQEMMLATFMRYIVNGMKKEGGIDPKDIRMLLETYEMIHELCTGEYDEQ